MADVSTRKGPPASPPSTIQEEAPFVAFKPDNVSPSQSTYLQLNDSLTLFAFTNTANYVFNFNYRYLTPQGEIKEGTFPFTPGLGGAFFQVPLGEAWLISFSVTYQSGATTGGYVFIEVGITRNSINPTISQNRGVIWKGYVYNFGENGWPGGPAKDAWDGPGSARFVTGTTPGAGADVSEAVASNRRWQILSFETSLTTSATVANRIPTFSIDSGGNNFVYQAAPNVAQTASQTVTYSLVPGSPFYNDLQGHIIMPLPALITYQSGGRIKSTTANIQVGDQWSAPIYLILEWASYSA